MSFVRVYCRLCPFPKNQNSNNSCHRDTETQPIRLRRKDHGLLWFSVISAMAGIGASVAIILITLFSNHWIINLKFPQKTRIQN